MQSQMTLYL